MLEYNDAKQQGWKLRAIVLIVAQGATTLVRQRATYDGASNE